MCSWVEGTRVVSAARKVFWFTEAQSTITTVERSGKIVGNILNVKAAEFPDELLWVLREKN